jgi:hypothetical protein
MVLLNAGFKAVLITLKKALENPDFKTASKSALLAKFKYI